LGILPENLRKMKTIIIAEAGVNHNGSLSIAKDMIVAASEAGADFVKFQTFLTGSLVSRKAKQADYQKKNLGKESSQFKMLKKLELNKDAHIELVKFCKKNKIAFLSTAFDLESINLLADLNMQIWKIPSGEITNLPYLRKVGSFNRPIILSTGMTNLGEIEAAINVLEESGTFRDKITVLHCTTEYPAPFDEVNLKAMVTIGCAFNVKVGYSDHTDGIVIPLAAVALGASVIEKHFTLDRNMDGPDHKASIMPGELKEMIDGIRKIEIALGNGIKAPSQSEIHNIVAARKSIVAAKTIHSGELFTPENITIKRPGNGISPMLWDQIIGLKSRRVYKPDELIEL
jgi:N,N'-diacetyllegionaminate synthase